ncbi:MAG TPA: tRNA-dihydrouridine synthase family protein [Gemmataceae bacterium]
MLTATEPALILAPMEGVTDAPMRALQGEAGAFTHAVSEFLRVSHSVLPKGMFLRHVPELDAGCRTPTGLPVQVQLLGGDPVRMAESAAVAARAGATAIDLNFGCPARTVNSHDGGATLLKFPHRIRDIVAAVRAAVPSGIPVSAKMRLGWDTIEAIDDNASMAAEGGAAWVTIHGRTRFAGYSPPIYWEPIGRIREQLRIPVVANGDIWTFDDFRRCRDATGCRHFMLGRGALANPLLAGQVARELGINPREPERAFNWPTLLHRLVEWSKRFVPYRSESLVRRLKQWLKMAATFGSFRGFDAIKRAGTVEELMKQMPT